MGTSGQEEASREHRGLEPPRPMEAERRTSSTKTEQVPQTVPSGLLVPLLLGAISIGGPAQPQKTDSPPPLRIPRPAHSSRPHRHTLLWFYYYKHTMALPHLGNPGLCMLYLPSLLYLDRATKKRPSHVQAQDMFDRAVGFIAYNDAISPVVKELYKNRARTPPMMLDCLIRVL